MHRLGIGLTLVLTTTTTAAAATATAQESPRLGDLLPAALRACPGPAGAADTAADRHSVYVPMADGVKLAVDVFVPAGATPGTRWPTLFVATRYWRGEKGRPLPAPLRPWIARGFAVVTADVRGTGASFGQWFIPYAPLEAQDIGALARWIGTQPWSNGKVVMTGNSYPGTTPLMAAAYGAPALKAIAPRFADFDLYSDLLFPGGVPSEALSVGWGTFVRHLDLNDRPQSQGVRPVDGPDGDAQLAAAVNEHRRNPHGFDSAAYIVTYKDEAMPQYGGLAIDDAGVFHLRTRAEQSGIPIFGWGSWLDSGIAQGLLNRFMTWSNPQLTIIGPWTHGAREDVNVFTPNRALEPSAEAQDEMVYCFLRNYVSDRPERLATHTLFYYTMGADVWKRTDVWPIPGTRQLRFYLDSGHALTTALPTAPGRDPYRVDFAASAGPANRWATQAGGPRINYGDRATADRALLVYTSAPLVKDMEVTGQAVTTLRAMSTHADGNFIVYLEDVDPDGKVSYVTEGELRAIHRKLSAGPAPYTTTYPYRTYAKADAEPLVPGQIATLTFQLMPTSVVFKAGHRIRIAIAGADAGTFLRIPAADQGDVTITVSHGGPQPSFIDLPVVP
jgi:uncharacterized protein